MIKPYYDKNGIVIYCGDCLEIMPKLEPGFDAIIADWPYGTTACSWDSVIPLDELWPECKRLTKKNGAIVLTASEPFNFILFNGNPQWFKYSWVWNKVNLFTNHLNAKKQPMRQHEIIMVFCENVSTYNDQKRKGKPYSSRGLGSTEVYGDFRLSPVKNNGIACAASILNYPAAKDRGHHPTQKPVALMAYLIRTYTNQGELILDNTMGSGTTLVAAQNEDRRAIGIEKKENYCKIAVERLRQPTFFSLSDEPKISAKQLNFSDSD